MARNLTQPPMRPATPTVRVGVVMGSNSDRDVMRNAAGILRASGVAYDVRVVSAHRTPDPMVTYGKSAGRPA
jgi:5-(carboxyamino)imidazole ribonucleotide mutase